VRDPVTVNDFQLVQKPSQRLTVVHGAKGRHILKDDYGWQVAANIRQCVFDKGTAPSCVVDTALKSEA
jgi:hypothetical protein